MVIHTLNYLIMQSRSRDYNIKVNAAFRIFDLVEKDAIADEDISKVQIILWDLLKDRDVNIRINALLSMFILLKNNKMGGRVMDRVLYSLAKEGGCKDVKIRKRALYGIASLIETKKLSETQIRKALMMFVESDQR